jgi:hypothetical protein
MTRFTSVIKLEEVTFGHLTELNGKFKMRATEFTFAPGGPWSASPYWARDSIYSFRRAHVLPPRTRQTSRFAF